MTYTAPRSGKSQRPRRLGAGALVAGALLALPLGDAQAQQELGLNVHQSSGVGLDVTRDAGLGWVRIDFNWLDAQPANGPPDFAVFDALVDAAKGRGLEVLAVVGYGPAWASAGDALGDGPMNDVPVDGTYAAFVQASVAHFKDRVTHYELWNEPNLEVFFEGTPADYTSRVLVPGAAAVHAECPSCKVVAPGLASIAGEYDVWLDAALTAAGDQIDIVSGHVYAGFDTADQTKDDFFDKLEAHRVVSVGGVVIYEGPLAFREVMAAHGATQPFWLTETGLEAVYGDEPAEDAQVLFYRHVLEAMLARPWWTNTIFYEAFDVAGQPYHWGVCLDDPAAPSGYQPKNVLAFLEHVTSTQPAFGGSGGDCGDGLDNDGDGLVDYPADPDCTSVLDASEAGSGAGGSGTGGAGAAAGAAGAPAADETSSGCALGHDRGDGSALALALACAALAGLRRVRRRER
ncbi:MAG: hypothetical protein IT373_09110 [Polyangiaceae bacterium]|nr:hypothetical protein [Polyangiaceae bacterium]